MKQLFSILILFIAFAAMGQQHYKVSVLPFNSPNSSEMAPFIYQNGLVFSSDRKNNIVLVTTDEQSNYPYHLYFVEKKGNKWGIPGLFSGSLTSRLSESSASFSSDYQTMYITRSQMATASISDISKADTIRNGIFECEPAGKDWRVVQSFYFNDESYDVAFPSISSDGRYLYFSSRQPGGQGGYDIYVSEKRGVSWSDPENLGAIINTPENEVYPFIHPNGRLYFSSRGHQGQGRIDIFYSEKRDGEWVRPINLPSPFNSRQDDFAYVLSERMDTGYFVSNRRGSDDIFLFASSFPAFPECPVQVDENFCYTFTETGSVDIAATSMKYEWDFGDGSKMRSIDAYHCYAKTGTYVVSLNVIDTLTGEIYFSEATYDLLVQPAEQPYIAAVDTAYVYEKIQLNGQQSVIRSFEPVSYFWDFGDGNIQTGLNTTHTYTNTGVFYVRLGVTDGQGEEDEKDKKVEGGRLCAQKSILVLKR
ncbi:MAG: PKD domain-containing protein [Bacteroidota bacterium]|nr:MAG: PKD domain-containing protein [Bacteroidota bacterium]